MIVAGRVFPLLALAERILTLTGALHRDPQLAGVP